VISVITPTFNERDNIVELVPEIFKALAGEDVEVVVVDDNSPDGTAEAARELAGKYNLKVVERTGERGLSSAVLAGFEAASGDVLAVIDADGSHPPQALPEMMKAVEAGADFVVGSRNVKGGSSAGWPLKRKIISKLAAMLARPVTSVSDPTSGFFMMRKDLLKNSTLSPKGFKIMLEVLVKCKPARVEEVPITFKDRVKGESKLGGGVALDYTVHLASLYLYRLTTLLR